MPKAQKKKSRSSDARATPLAARKADASKQPPGSKESSKSKNAADDEKGHMNSSKPRKANATSLQPSSAHSNAACNLLILATLRGSTNPTTTRLLSLPPSLTFDTLHRVLQISFGWANSLTHVFDINLVAADPQFSDPRPRGPMPNRVESRATLASVYVEKDWGHKAHVDYIHNHNWIHDLAFLGRETRGTNAQFGLPDNLRMACLHGQGQLAAEDVARMGMVASEGSVRAPLDGGRLQAG